jgi:hypothetical protein
VTLYVMRLSKDLVSYDILMLFSTPSKGLLKYM